MYHTYISETVWFRLRFDLRQILSINRICFDTKSCCVYVFFHFLLLALMARLWWAPSDVTMRRWKDIWQRMEEHREDQISHHLSRHISGCLQLSCEAFLNRGTQHWQNFSFSFSCSIAPKLNYYLVSESCSTLQMLTDPWSEIIPSNQIESDSRKRVREISVYLDECVLGLSSHEAKVICAGEQWRARGGLLRGNSLHLAGVCLRPWKASDSSEERLINWVV